MTTHTRWLAVALVASLNLVQAAEPESQTTPIVVVAPELLHLQKWDDMQGDTADPFWADDDTLYHFTYREQLLDHYGAKNSPQPPHR